MAEDQEWTPNWGHGLAEPRPRSGASKDLSINYLAVPAPWLHVQYEGAWAQLSNAPLDLLSEQQWQELTIPLFFDGAGASITPLPDFVQRTLHSSSVEKPDRSKRIFQAWVRGLPFFCVVDVISHFGSKWFFSKIPAKCFAPCAVLPSSGVASGYAGCHGTWCVWLPLC